jgi:uncharacterized protein YegL
MEGEVLDRGLAAIKDELSAEASAMMRVELAAVSLGPMRL